MVGRLHCCSQSSSRTGYPRAIAFNRRQFIMTQRNTVFDRYFDPDKRDLRQGPLLIQENYRQTRFTDV